MKNIIKKIKLQKRKEIIPSFENNVKKNEDMNSEQIELLKNFNDNTENKKKVKVLKKDKSLIERTESSKIIITEDNRQLLND